MKDEEAARYFETLKEAFDAYKAGDITACDYLEITDLFAHQAQRSEAGAKHDAGKLPWDLVPYTALEKVVAVYRFGAEKYGPNTWQSVPNARDRYFAAMMRHLVQWRKGERVDPESGCHHLAHVAWNCLSIMSMLGEQ